MAYIGIVSATDSEQLSPNYIGFQPTTQHPQSAFVVDTFTGNGVQTVFPLSNPKPVTSRALLVSVAGELLVPVNDYGLDSTGNIEFVSAPSAGAYITVHHLIFPKNEATTSIRKLDDISSQFDGVQTLFTLTANGVAASILGQNVLIISIDGVIQEPGIAYTMSGDDIIFSEAPSAVSSFYAVDIGTTGIGTPSDATVSPTKLLTDNNPSTGKVLAVNSSGGLTWATVSGNIGATDLDGLADVSIPTPLLAGQVLRYNGSTFVNAKLDYTDLNGPPTLATVATSGDYNDLTNTPVIPTDIGAFTDVSNILFNGDYGSLTNLPSIPNQITDLTDIDIVTPANGDVLVWNGLKWINDNLTLNDLGIVDGTAGQVLTTNGSGNFTFTTISGAGGGGSSYILPAASGSVLGGVKIGTGLSIDGTGVVSVTSASSADKLTNGSYNFTLEAQGYIKVPTSQYGTAQMFSNAGVDLLIGTLDSGNYWQLKTNGDLVFPDNTTQTTAYTGDYNDLTNTPTIPTDTNQLTNSAGFITLGDVPAGFSGDYNDLTNTPTLATVATSGSYDDLTNKPTSFTGLTSIDAGSITLNGEALTATGLINSSYLFAKNNATQSGIGIGQPINFQTTLNSNGNLINKISNTQVRLTGGHTYKLEAIIGRFVSSSTWGMFRWYDVTNGAYVGVEGFSEVVSAPGAIGTTNNAKAIVSPSSNTTYELRQTTGNTIEVSGDYAHMEVTQINPTVTLGSVSTITATGEVSGNTLVSTNASANEGGEVQLAKSPNSSLSGSNVVIDQYVDRVRIYENGSNYRGAYIDLSIAATGVGTLLNNRASGFVNAGVDVTLGNLRARIPTSGNRSLQVSTVSGTYSVYGSSVYNAAGTIGGTNITSGTPVSVTTTPAYLNAVNNFTVAGDSGTWTINDTGAGLAWRISFVIGPGYANNMISIERLV